ncbi:MAG: hypothetical protein U0X91_06080 [Spirosomataceae bacterium]
MKRTLSIFASALLILLSVACKKENEAEPDPETAPVNQTGEITPVGTPEVEAVSATIGPAGGSIESADKRLRVTIPAGALSTTQTISVQPISNHCPSGQGQAYRLTPHGLPFAKPATITIQYTESDLEGTFAEALAVAWQTEEGKWAAVAPYQTDTLSKELSVQTTHFSDWSLYQSIFINPKEGYVDPGKQVTLSVYKQLPSIEGDLKVIPAAAPLDRKYIKGWSLAGEGILRPSDPNNNKAIYTAPGYIPANNPVTVAVEVTMPGGMTGKIFTRIYVAPEGLIYRINGGRWVTTVSELGAYTVDSPGRGTFITFRAGNKTGSSFSNAHLIWKADQKGRMLTDINITMPWELDKKNINAPQFLLNENPTGHPIYVYYYEQGRSVYPSPGYLTFNKKAADLSHQYVVGKFLLEKAGIVESTNITDPFIGTAKIEGFFRVKLNN